MAATCGLGCGGDSLETARLDLLPRPAPHWIKVKNPNAPTVKRQAEENWER
jgi:hypothetical protein